MLPSIGPSARMARVTYSGASRVRHLYHSRAPDDLTDSCIADFRLLHQAAFAAVDQWSRMRHPNIVHLHEAFTTRAFGDSCE